MRLRSSEKRILLSPLTLCFAFASKNIDLALTICSPVGLITLSRKAPKEPWPQTTNVDSITAL